MTIEIERHAAQYHTAGGRPWALAEMSLRGSTRVVGADSSLLSSDGNTVSATAYEIDLSAGDVVIGGVFGAFAALTDQDLLADVDAYNLDGTAPTALADGDAVEIAICAVLVDGSPALVFVFGDQVTDSEEVAPTEDECRVALALSGLADYYPSPLGLVVGRINASRSGSTVTLTHAAAASDASLRGERSAGALG